MFLVERAQPQQGPHWTLFLARPSTRLFEPVLATIDESWGSREVFCDMWNVENEVCFALFATLFCAVLHIS